MKIPLIVALSSGPVADGITALTIAVYLYRSSPRMRRMKQIVTWLLVMTVNTGFILFANGLCALITYLTMPDSFAWSGMLLISGKLYANSLFAMLNGRNALRAKLSEPMIVRTTEITTSSVSRDDLITQPERVHIYREVYRGVDIDSNGNPVKQDEVGEDISAEQFCAR
ncbi:hypothetical protein QCA50_007709 [Cerrena zonata]|uniref:DUF6534 domain-containing protein n=1 Tax=Cerrena zonata TaxID=2478898 RepID=A0AAW0G5U0_9APHY